jgi:hypothetical protein
MMITMKGGGARTTVFLLFALCATLCSAFVPVAVPLSSSVVGAIARKGVWHVGFVPSRTVTTSTVVTTRTVLGMAKPGMSEERARQEREADIQSKISKLKSQGRMKNKDGGGKQSAEDSAMLEAEAFFSKPSPLRKFEKSQAERKQRELEAVALEAEAAAAEEESSELPDSVE